MQDREHQKEQVVGAMNQVQEFVTKVEASKATAEQQLQQQREGALKVCSWIPPPGHTHAPQFH